MVNGGLELHMWNVPLIQPQAIAKLGPLKHIQGAQAHSTQQEPTWQTTKTSVEMLQGSRNSQWYHRNLFIRNAYNIPTIADYAFRILQ